MSEAGPGQASPVNDPIKGGLYMAIGMLAFAINDTLVKLVGVTMPTGELLLVRGLFTIVILLALCWFTGVLKSLPMLLTKPVAMRAAADLVTTVLFITALINMPLANANAILQAVPFVAIVMATIFLGERVGWRRMSAVTVGFAGVLLVVKPGGADFNEYSLFAVGALFSVAVRDIITRRIPANVPSLTVALANAVVVTLGGAVWGGYEGLEPLDATQTGYLLASALMIAAAYLFTVLGLRTADISATAPMRYTMVPWTLLFGYLVFGDIPDHWAFAGMLLIAGSGVYALHREARLKRAGQNVTHISKRYRW